MWSFRHGSHCRTTPMAMCYPMAVGHSKGDRWPRTWASRGTAAAAGVSPNTPSSCGTWSRRCAASPLMSGRPWSCSRSSRTSGPASSSRKGWGHTSVPRGRERSWAMSWPPWGKWQPRTTEPFPSVHNKPFQKKKKKDIVKRTNRQATDCQEKYLQSIYLMKCLYPEDIRTTFWKVY